jgi:telomere length regulation protein
MHVTALEAFLHQVLDFWTSAEHVKYSLLGMHHCKRSVIVAIQLRPSPDITELLLLVISQFVGDCKLLQTLSVTPSFVSAVSLYISHTDPSIRICGMLVAEEVAQRSGRKLDFKIWDGDGDGKDWARRIRRLLNKRDVDSDIQLPPIEKKVQPDRSPGTSAPKASSRAVHVSNATEDSDDSLEGYAESSASSSRPPSPTMSELEEQERDATLRNPGKKRIHNPVYLVDLGRLLKFGKEGPEQAESIEVALRCAAGLVRRKEGYGNELGMIFWYIFYSELTFGHRTRGKCGRLGVYSDGPSKQL